MGEIRFVGTGETRGYPYLVCKKLQSHGTELIIIVGRYSGTGQIRTQSLPKTSKGKVDKHLLTNNRIIQLQLFPKLVATQLPFTELNKLDTQKCKIKTFRNWTAPNKTHMKARRKYRLGTASNNY